MSDIDITALNAVAQVVSENYRLRLQVVELKEERDELAARLRLAPAGPVTDREPVR